MASVESENHYVLGTSDAELDRLGLQNQVWQPQMSALWERAGFGPGQTLLDAGCGPGYSTVDLAQLVGAAGRVLALDAAPDFAAQARDRAAALGLRQVEVQVADLQRADLEAASLDGAFARWVVSFVPNPAAVIARLAPALRPGAPLVVVDYFHYTATRMFPGGEIFERLFEHFAEANRQSGGDYDNSARIPEWAGQAGLTIEHLAPVQVIARPGDRYWCWFKSFCRVFAPTLEKMALVDEDFCPNLFTAIASHEQDPAAFFFAPPMLAAIARRKVS